MSLSRATMAYELWSDALADARAALAADPRIAAGASDTLDPDLLYRLETAEMEFARAEEKLRLAWGREDEDDYRNQWASWAYGPDVSVRSALQCFCRFFLACLAGSFILDLVTNPATSADPALDIVEGLRRYTDDSTGFQLEVTYERGTLTVVMCMWDDGDETLLDVAVDDVAAARAAFVAQAIPAIESTDFSLHTIRPA